MNFSLRGLLKTDSFLLREINRRSLCLRSQSTYPARKRYRFAHALHSAKRFRSTTAFTGAALDAYRARLGSQIGSSRYVLTQTPVKLVD